MPLKHPDPFVSRAEELDAAVNPYVALLRDGAASGSLPVVFGPGLQDFPGRWREHIRTFHGLTSPHRRLVVEIGCHKGVTLLEMAAAHPDCAFVGIDITFKRVVTTAQRAANLGLTNVYCALANAVAIDRLFAPAEVDACVIFFPDPWIKKKRQAKNRLVDAPFCAKLGQTLAPGGFLWLKTDQEPYFTEAASHLEAAGFRALTEPQAGLLDRDYSSTFERRFQEQSLATHGGRWTIASRRNDEGSL